MKVAHLIWSLKVGGSETMLIDIANEQALTNDVTLVLGNAVLDSTVLKGLSSRVKLISIGRPPGSRNPWYILKLLHTVKKLSPDIVHAHQESFIRVVRLLSAPKVLTVHDTNQELHSVIEYDAVYSISEAVRHDINTKHPDCLTEVVPNGIYFSALLPKTSYGQLPFRIVQVSRLYHDIKGQDILLRALQHVSEAIGGGRVLVDFVGEGTSREYLGALAEQLGVAPWCSFLGQQPRTWVYKNLHTYDLLVQPSRYEGFGLTVVEAMAARVPVLVSNIEGPMEIVGNGKYGYFFRTEDSVDCSEKIASVMKDSQRGNFSEELLGNAEYAKSRFDIANTARKYLEAYSKVIRRMPAGNNHRK